MQRDSMADDWLARLKGHADLVQRLVKEIPKALEKPGLTLEQASRLHAVIQKGARDFDQLVGESYRRAATSLAKIWSHLSNAAADRVQGLQEAGDAEYDDGVSGEPIDKHARSDRDDV